MAKAKPDGYTLLLGVPSAITVNQFVYKKMPYDPVRDLAPVTQIATNTFGVVVTRSLPATSIKGLVALAKSRPGELIYASAGIGNLTHLAGELFAQAAGVKMLHVPYKGTTPAQVDVISGQAALTFVSMRGIAEQVEAGKVRLLATMGDKRDPAFPKTPTLVESGYPGSGGDRLERFAGARRHAAGHRQQALARDRPPSQRPRISRSHGEPGRRSVPEHAGSVRRVHQGGSREVAESDTRDRARAQPVRRPALPNQFTTAR